MHSDVQEVCGSGRIVTALFLGAVGCNCSIDFLLHVDAKHLSGVESLHLLIFSVRLYGCIHTRTVCVTTYYRHIVEYSDLVAFAPPPSVIGS